MAGPANLTPRAVIAAPLYNHASYLEEALESLLAQSERNFALLLVDDVSDDETPLIARGYASRDPRVHFYQNPDRLGLVANWRRAFELSRELFPDARYFAWGSDHDVWHPRWLESLLAELERSPRAVLAYPVCERIAANGRVSHARAAVDTHGVRDPATRVRACYRGMHAGDMVYGLVRADCMERAGVFRPVLEPDRLLMAELAVQGEFRLVPTRLWQRRFLKTKGRARQRRAIFPQRRPLHSWLPPAVVRPALFLWIYGLRGNPAAVTSRSKGLRLAVEYARATAGHVRHRRTHRLRRRWGHQRKRVARTRKALVRPVRRWAGLLRRESNRAARLMRTASISRTAMVIMLVAIALVAFAAVTFAAARLGTASANLLRGSAGGDLIRGYSGNDTILGLGGDDRLDGGEGDDRLRGLSGNDALSGAAGADLLAGGTGNDLTAGGPGDDVSLGGSGNDVMYSGPGRDSEFGGAGDDRLYAWSSKGPGGTSPLRGGALDGGTGHDVLSARNGITDRLVCGRGVDLVLADRKDVVADASARRANGSCETVLRDQAARQPRG